MELLSFSDSFLEPTLNADRWGIYSYYDDGEANQIGFECQANEGLHLVFPMGYTSTLTNSPNEVRDTYGLVSKYSGIGFYHQTPLIGDFDVEVSFSDFQSIGSDATLRLALSPSNPTIPPAAYDHIVVCRYGQGTSNQGYGWENYGGLTTLSEVAPNLDSGKLRLKRAGSTLTGYYWSTSASAWVNPPTWVFYNWQAGPIYVGVG